MHIDSYRFGEIVVDGVSYNNDIIIFGGFVHPNWWRKHSHLLSAEDIQLIIASKPSTLIVGCGTSGLMQVQEETRQLLQERNIQLEASDTSEAVRRFNELSKAGIDVAAALHITC